MKIDEDKRGNRVRENGKRAMKRREIKESERREKENVTEKRKRDSDGTVVFLYPSVSPSLCRDHGVF